MAVLSTDEDKARKVLTIFGKLGAKAGHVLSIASIAAAGFGVQLSAQDMNDGIAHGAKLGWFEEVDSGAYKLTDIGFAENRHAGPV